MDPAIAGAVALAKKLEKDGHECTRNEDVITVNRWDLYIRMRLVDADDGERPSVTYETDTYHEVFEQPVQDVANGLSRSMAESCQQAAEVYLGSVFPVVHAMLCGHPGGDACRKERLFPPDTSGIPREWTVIRGPVLGQSLQDTDPRLPNDRFYNVVEDLLKPYMTGSGILWMKCFAARIGDKRAADCFVNNTELPEGKQRFLELTAKLPGDQGFSTCKQHILLHSLDWTESYEARREKRRQRWREVISRRASGLDRAVLDAIVAAIESFRTCHGFEEWFIRDHLAGRGVSEDLVDDVVSFVPAACARFHWMPKGVVFKDEFVRINLKTQRSERKRLPEEPTFGACVAAVRALVEAKLAGKALRLALNFSAENNVVGQALAKKVEPQNIRGLSFVVVTDKEVDGPVDQELLARMGIAVKKPWWRFW